MANNNNLLVAPFEVPLIVSQKNDVPIVELRKCTNSTEIIKMLIKCAFNNKPLVIYPVFTDKIRAVSSLIDKGIIYKEGNNYFFTL